MTTTLNKRTWIVSITSCRYFNQNYQVILAEPIPGTAKEIIVSADSVKEAWQKVKESNPDDTISSIRELPSCSHYPMEPGCIYCNNG
jgi:hypothetical protein